MVLAFLLFILLGGPSTAGSREIFLGMSAAFTGPSRDLGCKLYQGAMTYLHHVNQQGGVHGNTIVLLTLDDGYNPEPTIANTIRFVDFDDVFCLFNYVGTPTVTRMLPLLSKYVSRPLYLLFPFTGAQPQRKPPYEHLVFDFRTSYQAEVKALTDLFRQRGYSRFAILYQADAYGRSGWQSMKNALAHHDLTFVGQASYRRGQAFEDSFEPQVTALAATSPEVIISIAASEAAAGFIRDARDTGMNVPIANISFVDPNTLINLLAPLRSPQGTNYFANLINSQVVPFFADPDLPASREYMTLIAASHDIPSRPGCKMPINHYMQSGPISFEGFLNAKLLVRMLETMGSFPDPKDLPRAFAALDGEDIGIGHPLRIEPGHSQISNAVHFIAFSNATMFPVDAQTFQVTEP
ncbi:ABC transporter substrate-binding protein [Desulfoplanes formicivorans]|uniref:ABC transporter substrate-binding protein n=1 Tax=Desulfoplanes formicivorans TaxID=1592317 RepID=A0A194AGK6_9BACT|nr:ABC transporter substrate-binding protein [Desulfoplanes formicivorans]